MRGIHSLCLAALAAGAVSVLPLAAVAQAGPKRDLDHISVRYHRGMLLEHVQVSTLFWGKEWDQNPLCDYFNQFFQDLFADGRYMANLGQYSTATYRVGNGAFVGTMTAPTPLKEKVTDEEIRAEIRAQIAAGKLPSPAPNTLYVVFAPPHVVVQRGSADSERDFLAYHEYAYAADDQPGDFAYVVVAYVEDGRTRGISPGNPHLMTAPITHELAEAVTDPEPALQDVGQGGWYDQVGRTGEIGDIPVYLYDAHRIGDHDLWDVLEAPGGRRYLVQKEWSPQAGRPVAFAQAAPQETGVQRGDVRDRVP